MISHDDKTLLLDLLATSNVLNDNAKLIIRTALEEQTMPDVDAQYILFVLKNEKNFDYILAQRGERLLEEMQHNTHV